MGDAFLQKIIASERCYRINQRLSNNKLYNATWDEMIRGLQRYRAYQKIDSQLKNEKMRCSYETMEGYLQFVGTLLVVPVIAMAVSKESVKTQRDQVQFRRIDVERKGECESEGG